MIEENYPYFCLRGLSRWPAPGNPRGRKFDLFRSRQGSPINFGKIYENWASDAFSIKFTEADLNAAGRAMFDFFIGYGRFVSNKAVITLRAGNVEDPIATFQDTYFIVKFNGSEKYRFRGWDDIPREFYWRLEGGERIELVVFSELAVALPQSSFLYFDMAVMYEPQALILDQEDGSADVTKITGNTGRRL